MERQPLTKQRSEWRLLPGGQTRIARIHEIVELGGSTDVMIYERRVGDGWLNAIVSLDAGKWHMSISFEDHRGRPSRYPRWDEIADARYRLCSSRITMAMLLPPPSEYVAVHDTTFHLHEIDGEPRVPYQGTSLEGYCEDATCDGCARRGPCHLTEDEVYLCEVCWGGVP